MLGRWYFDHFVSFNQWHQIFEFSAGLLFCHCIGRKKFRWSIFGHTVVHTLVRLCYEKNFNGLGLTYSGPKVLNGSSHPLSTLCSLYLDGATIVRTDNFYYSAGPLECQDFSGDMLYVVSPLPNWNRVNQRYNTRDQWFRSYVYYRLISESVFSLF